MIGQLILLPSTMENNELLLVLIESGKKVDKVILYCLLCMPNSFQYVV